MRVRHFSRLGIGARLAAAFGIVMVLMAALVGTAVTRLVSIKAQTQQIVQRDWISAEAAHAVDAAARDDARSAVRLLTQPDKEQRAPTYARMEMSRRAIATALDQLKAQISSEQGKALLKSIEASNTKYQTSANAAAKLLEEFSGDDAIARMTQEAFPALDQMLADIQALVTLQKRQLEDNGAKAERDVLSALTLLVGLGLAALLAGISFAYWITRSITTPLKTAVDMAQRVARGDLTASVDIETDDETGQLLAALQDMNGSLSAIVAKVRGGTEVITSASGNIAHDNVDLAHRSRLQASSLKETAVSMEQLTSAVYRNADHAKQANQLANETSCAAVRGGQVVSSMVSTMESVKDSSRRIVDIIGVIDSIAFQTNILALNAAVEAARAGEQGRGFAVVAGEVRNLAQRVASAAKEIKLLISDSVEKVEAGSSLVTQASSTITQVVESIQRVAGMVVEISRAGDEQRMDIARISSAITDIDRVTQETAVVMEKATSTARQMESQADALAHSVSVFKVAHTEVSPQ